MRKNIRDFTLGADPEFLAATSKTGTSVPAYDYVDIDECLSAGFGCDGNDRLIELRPDPSRDPLVVVSNLRQILINSCTKKNGLFRYYWIAGSSFEDRYDIYTFGGHIHFGVSKRFIGVRNSTRLLSQYVGACSVLLEDKKGAKRRREDDYGYFLDYRTSNFGFEYRTPSSWLVSPYVAASLLCLAKVVYFEVLNNPEFEIPDFIHPQNINRVETGAIKSQFPKIWQSVEKMFLFPQYQPYLQIIPFLVDNNLTWFPTCTMQQAWGVDRQLNQHLPKTSYQQIWRS